jgi:ABC-type lipoprotein release transport system permease subunit
MCRWGTMLYPEVDLTWLVVAPLLGAVTSALASVYPARVAARMAPAEAVRA